MVTLQNIELLRQAEQGYLVGLQRRNRKDIPEYIFRIISARAHFSHHHLPRMGRNQTALSHLATRSFRSE